MPYNVVEADTYREQYHKPEEMKMFYFKVYHNDNLIDTDWANDEFEARETVHFLSGIPEWQLVAKKSYPGS